MATEPMAEAHVTDVIADGGAAFVGITRFVPEDRVLTVDGDPSRDDLTCPLVRVQGMAARRREVEQPGEGDLALGSRRAVWPGRGWWGGSLDTTWSARLLRHLPDPVDLPSTEHECAGGMDCRCGRHQP